VVQPRCPLELENCPEGHLGSSSTMESWYVHTIMSSLRGGRDIKLGNNNNNMIHGQSVLECRGVHIVEFGFNILVFIIGPI
jgi:hypothetical protein